MIDLSQKLIVSLVFCSFVCGICLGGVYEVARFIRCLISPCSRRGNGIRAFAMIAVTFLTDLFFLVLFSICGILITFDMCGGVFRGAVYISMAFGILIYRVTLGKLTAIAVRWLAGVVKGIIKWAVRIIILPVRGINFLIVKLYTLTIGKIIGRIKARILVRRLSGLFIDGEDAVSGELPAITESSDKGYRKEGRVSFGGKKDE